MPPTFLPLRADLLRCTGHNSFLIMHPPCQERYKHSIPPQKAIDAFYPKWNAEERFIPAEDRERCKARMGLTFRSVKPILLPSPSFSFAD